MTAPRNKIGWGLAGVLGMLGLPSVAQAQVTCGNGVINAGEQCDDRNAGAGDGCGTTCQLEPGFACATAGAACTVVCGDNIRVPSLEGCDDGNTASGDGCSSLCVPEFGFLCADTTTNLVRNGDFRLGNASFTSQYNFDDSRDNAQGQGGGMLEGNYTVTSNPAGWHQEFRPHGDLAWVDGNGDGFAALFNGVANRAAYQTTITVKAGTVYQVGMGCADWGQFNLAQLLMRIDGTEVTRQVSPPSTGGVRMVWVPIGGTYRAARSGTVTVEIVDRRTNDGGNDFAVDEIVVRTAAATQCVEADTDMDGVPDRVEGTTNDSDNDGTPDFRDPDDDGDGIPTRTERPGNADLDTDNDARPNYLDNDDDNDTVLTRDERPGGADANTDNDAQPDHLDPDDDADGIPTRRERELDPTATDDFDGDNTPSYRDTDADGDGDLDRDEAGGAPAEPVDTDGDGDRDFLDRDSDNDCLLDSDARENGAARTNRMLPSASANNNCAAPTPVCNTNIGQCVMGNDRDGDGLRDDEETNQTRTDPDDPDTDADGIPDGTEVGPNRAAPVDTDMDGRIDALDPDDDNDTIPTRTERPGNANVDTDRDSRPDHLDPDDDGDGIPTAREAGQDPTANDDFDGDGLPSYRDLDSDGDGDLDREEGGSDLNNPVDTDRDGDPDYLDRDSDNDCLPDSDPAEDGANRINSRLPSADANSNCAAPTPVCNTMTGQCVGSGDRDRDGIPDEVETAIGTNPDNPDTDGDSIPDGEETGPNQRMPRDTDMDGRSDPLDNDDDNDTVPTRTERNNGAGDRDTDMDGRPDHLDPDDDNDGIPTAREAAQDGSTGDDLDMDGLPSYRDLDSDNDGDTDRDEAGADRTNPADTDRDTAPDYLDTDSDNDCAADSDRREDGAARTDPRMPAADPNANCASPTPLCNTMTGRCVSTGDRDGDGIPDDVERTIGTNPDDPDTDRDSVPDGQETGPNQRAPRDSDGDGMIDPLDPDDDADTVPTREERNNGTMDRDTDMDGRPDHIDPDDDGDGIPTRAEREHDTSSVDDFDNDGNPSYRDTDADGDGDLDRDEAGADTTMPADTDRDGARDYLDTDSDNDCAADSVRSEDGAARVTPATNPDSNCTNPTPVCDSRRGVCVRCYVNATMQSVGCNDASDGRACFVTAGSNPGPGICGCRDDADCTGINRCDTATQRCVRRDNTDAGVTDAGPGDAGPGDGGAGDGGAGDGGADAGFDGGVADSGTEVDGGTLPPSSTFQLTGDGCACRVGAGGTSTGNGLAAVGLGLALAGVLSARSKRRQRR